MIHVQSPILAQLRVVSGDPTGPVGFSQGSPHSAQYRCSLRSGYGVHVASGRPRFRSTAPVGAFFRSPPYTTSTGSSPKKRNRVRFK
ncbi:hypothetical protein DPMN_056879 [Dreissena polymorpha]|uniref:Uncharacterized protein n=1 Tax=Dreissena polymorpha TaxID=45954 RepID=A0A9D4CVD8_DREPO|nr:hypothetical protein DPMN_056879 [Dreissena polymorpha]